MPSPLTLKPLHRPLGTTGISVSPIGLGTVKLGRNTAVKYPTPFDLPSDADTTHLLESARTLGINLIDTAPAYALAEQRLGTLLPGPREDWVIVTKAGEEFSDGKSHFDFSHAAITASVHRSLKHLNTDIIDAVLLHSDGNDTDIIKNSGGDPGDGGLEALKSLKEQGHIRAYGISTKTPEGALLAIEHNIDILMLTLNPLNTDDLPAINAAHKAGVAVLIKKALISGHVGPTTSTTTSLTPEHCIDFTLSTPGVTAAILGTINPDHLTQNVAAAITSLNNQPSQGSTNANQ